MRRLRQHHPAAKAIVTSDTETNMPPEGYGMFLSKPYRLADLDYCLQKVLAPGAHRRRRNRRGNDRRSNQQSKSRAGRCELEHAICTRRGRTRRGQGARGRRLPASDSRAVSPAWRASGSTTGDRSGCCKSGAPRRPGGVRPEAGAPAEIGAGVRRGGDRLFGCRLPCPDDTLGGCPAVSQYCGQYRGKYCTTGGTCGPPRDGGGRNSDARAASGGVALVGIFSAVAHDRRRLHARRRACANRTGGRRPTGTCRSGAGPEPAAARRNEGSPGETAVLWLQSRAGRRIPRGPDGQRRHALPAEPGPTANRQGRP